MRTIGIFGGGTISNSYPHLSLCAPAYGGTARKLYKICQGHYPRYASHLYLSKMCGDISFFETNEDLQNLINGIKGQLDIIFMPVAVCDFNLNIIDHQNLKRLSSKFLYKAELIPAQKIVKTIRDENHKHIYVVQFKTTVNKSLSYMFNEGINALKENHSNLVLVNDLVSHYNLIVTPEGGEYGVVDDRQKTLEQLVNIAIKRSEGTFYRTTIESGNLIDFDSPLVPNSLKQVVQHCIKRGHYKTLDNGSTPGHFATKLDENTFLSSIRGSDYNKEIKMVMVKICGDEIIAYGAKPSAGAKSQRQIFLDHPDMTNIVHFHKHPKINSKIHQAAQINYECGSMECGINTSSNLKEVIPGVMAVYLEKHGPNIVFNKNVDPAKVIGLINENFL